MIELDLEGSLCRRTSQSQPQGTPEILGVLQRPSLGILIVDDEAYMRGFLEVGLRQEGCAVWLAPDGYEALELYQRHHESIDMVLLDIRMPGRDGPQTLAALQNLNPQIRCCFMSGDLGTYTEERLLNLGAVAVFPKPFYLNDVAQLLLTEGFHRRRATTAHRQREILPLGSET